MNTRENPNSAGETVPSDCLPVSVGPAGDTVQGDAPADVAQAATQPWSQFVETAGEKEIKARYEAELRSLLSENVESLPGYQILLLLCPHTSLDAYDLNVVYDALSTAGRGTRDVLLILLSRGGEIEPAYQISKLCKMHARDRFIVAVPREAKSAATLLALGADELHIGPLGQLGPIDVQLGGRPALAVKEALHTIASISHEFPRSAKVFAEYLRRTLKVEHIGYCERISESAVQYALRLLSGKPALGAKAEQIARDLVYAYKDHGFVIDLEEARSRLGNDWIRTDTPELEFAERVYRSFHHASLFPRTRDGGPRAYMEVRGGIDAPRVMLFNTGA